MKEVKLLGGKRGIFVVSLLKHDWIHYIIIHSFEIKHDFKNSSNFFIQSHQNNLTI